MRTCVFIWENLGPTHEDRLAALANQFPGQVFAIEFSGDSETYSWEGGQPHAVPTTTLFDRPEDARGLRCAIALVRGVRQFAARDVYFCHYERWPVLLAATFLRLIGYRPILMIDSKYDDYPRFRLRELMKRAFLWPYSAALTASTRSRDYLYSLGFRRRPIRLGYDTLSVNRIQKLSGAPRAPAGMAHQRRHFLVIARLEPKKNLSCALEAYSLWRRAGGTGRTLRVLGSGSEEIALKRKAEALGIDDGVVFEGFVQTGRVSEALASALCLLLPSIEEQFGLVVIEAMAMGVPAVVSHRAGAVDVMLEHGVNGYIIDPSLPESVAAAMTELSSSEDRWRQMAFAAQADSLRGDVVHFVDAVSELSAPGQLPSDE